MKAAYTVAETAESLGLGKTKTFELLASGELRSFVVGRRRLVPVGEVESFISRHLAGGG